uniref:HTH_48 domain-containing protein n=1 Tax=Steinernema glaseri TaxID=37863 RepID=A0A1I7XWJ0_9BILA
MPVEDAVDMFKKRCMTVGTLSKYWLSPSTWASRREKEMNLSSATAQGNYSYASRYSRPAYSSVASRLS